MYCEICYVGITIYMPAHINIFFLKRAQIDDWKKEKKKRKG